MSRKTHLIVPRWFALADVEGLLVHEARCQRVTSRQARAMAQAGMIRQLGESGRIWQLAELATLPPVFETGDGLLSLGRKLTDVLRSEITRRRIDDTAEN